MASSWNIFPGTRKQLCGEWSSNDNAVPSPFWINQEAMPLQGVWTIAMSQKQPIISLWAQDSNVTLLKMKLIQKWCKQAPLKCIKHTKSM